ncbi:unnamed protein product [Prunus armeniaca]
MIKVCELFCETDSTEFVIVTIPRGHTLPDFLDASISKIFKLKHKISSATSAIKSVFGPEQPQLGAVSVML